MLKHKSIIFLLVSSFTILSSALWADTGVDAGADVSLDSGTDLGASSDIGSDLAVSTDVGSDASNEGQEKSTPLDPDFQPEVTSSSDCTCRSVQSESNFGWFSILLIGAALGFSRKKCRRERSKT